MFRSPKEIARTSSSEPPAQGEGLRRVFKIPFLRGVIPVFLGLMALGAFFPTYRAAKRHKGFASAMAPVERLLARVFLPAKAPKVLTPEMKEVINTAPHKGRRVRAIKLYRKLAQRLKDAKASGHDTTEAEKKLADAAGLIQGGEYDLAEQAMSRIDFFVPKWLTEPAEAP